MAKQAKFPPAERGAPIMRTGPRSQRAKLQGLIKGNPAFEGFEYDEGISDEDLATAMREHLSQSQEAAPVPRAMTIDAENKE